jgi:hypothetical protein
VSAVRSKVPFLEKDMFMTPLIEVRAFVRCCSFPSPKPQRVVCVGAGFGLSMPACHCLCTLRTMHMRQAVWELLRDGAILRAVDLSAVPTLKFPTSLLSASSILRSATLPATTPVFKSAADDADVEIGLPGRWEFELPVVGVTCDCSIPSPPASWILNNNNKNSNNDHLACVPFEACVWVHRVSTIHRQSPPWGPPR